MKKIIYTHDAPEPLGPYSQAILIDRTLYCSGQIAVRCLDADVRTQTDQVCKNIAAVLKAANMTLSNVVKTTCFLDCMADFSDFNEVYAQYFVHEPARSCVAAKELPKGALVEIEVLAIADK